LFVFGLVAAVLYVRTGRLGPGIVAHLAFNATAVYALLA
jgi:membrane protease YdiL (CAAX protease family)